MHNPRVFIIAGPNGAGKTTFAWEFLTGEARCPTFINADLIAAGLSPFQPESVATKAMRLMAQEMHARVERGDDFAIESTLSGRTYARNIEDWKTRGYQVKIIFLRLPSVDLAIERVALRVQQGGHSIPEHVIRRRYDRGWENFENLYRPLADSWQLYDSNHWPPILADDRGMMQWSESEADMAGSQAAMVRAARRVCDLAKRNGQSLAFWSDGKVVRINTGELSSLSRAIPERA